MVCSSYAVRRSQYDRLSQQTATTELLIIIIIIIIITNDTNTDPTPTTAQYS